MNEIKKTIILPKEGKTRLSRRWVNRVVAASQLGKLFYNLHHEGMDNIPKQGPAIILSKHQQYMDTVLIMMTLKEKIARYSYFFMKYSLSDFLETNLGGIKFLNVNDFRTLTEQYGKDEAKRMAKEFNTRSYSYIEKIIESGEILTIYPEGGIRRKKMGQIIKHPIKMFEKMQARIPEKIPVIPLGIEFENWYKDLFCCPPSRITIRAGKPRYFVGQPLKEFCEDIYEEIRTLSGL